MNLSDTTLPPSALLDHVTTTPISSRHSFRLIPPCTPRTPRRLVGPPFVTHHRKRRTFFSHTLAETREDRVQKRKAQLRQAQQTYRERKDKYTKILEGQIAAIRASEARLLSEVQDLRQKVEALEGYIHDCGTAVPDVAARYNIADKTQIDSKAAHPSHGRHYGRDAKFSQKPSPSNPDQDTAWSASASPVAAVRMGDVDPLVAGMEFVLTLESPCLPHLHGDPEKPDEASCHALTSSAQLAAMYPESSIQSSAERGALCAQVPGRMLDSLLNLSTTLCPVDHVTPVQAWSHIRSQPHFGGLEVGILHSLAEKLRDSVKCHGFGAVISQDTFSKLVFDHLFLGRLV